MMGFQRKWLKAFPAALFVFLETLCTVQAQTAREIFQYASPSVVVLVAENLKGKRAALGSGFFIGENIVATNYHVIKGSSRIYTKIVGQKEVYKVERIVAVDAVRDLAIIKVSGVTATSLILGESLVNVGDTIYAVGNPEGLEGTLSQGIVSGIRQIGDNRYIQITASLSHGSSGGPVLNKAGEVIGISVGSLTSGQNLNFAIPVSELVTLLNHNNIEVEKGIGRPDSESVAITTRIRPDYSPEAKSHINNLLEERQRNPKSAQALYNLGEVYERYRYYEEAVDAYKRATLINSMYTDAYFRLGRIYDGLGKSIFHIDSSSKNESNRYLEAAVEAYKQVIRINPKYIESYIALGETLNYLHKIDEARGALKRAINHNPNYAPAYYTLGIILGSNKHYKEAIDALKTAIRIKPDYSDEYSGGAYAKLGEYYIALGSNKEAIEAYKQAVHISPSSFTHNTLGEAYIKLGYSNEAIEAFNEAIRIGGKNLVAYWNLAEVYIKLKQYKEAIEILKRGISLDAGDSLKAHTYTLLGAAYIGLGRYEDSLEVLRQSIRLDPTNPKSHNVMGEAYLELRQYNKAVEAFQLAISRFAGINAFAGLGTAYLELGRYSEANVAFTQVLKLGIKITDDNSEALEDIRPDIAAAIYGLGIIDLRMGKRESALEHYKRLKEISKELANKLFNEIYK
jgi:tetratricopeptide (TPR) repeat protein